MWSRLNLGNHISRCLGRGCSGGVIWITPRLFRDIFYIMGVPGTKEVSDDVEAIGDWVVEEVSPVALLITIAIVDCDWGMWMEKIKWW